MLADWLLIACVFAALLGLYALAQFALDHIAQGIREFREADPWP